MATENPIIGANHGGRGVKVPFLRVADEPAGSVQTYFDLVSGTGVPSGGYGRSATSRLLYVRLDSSTADTVLYVSHDGGTTWSTVEASNLTAALLASTSSGEGAALVGIEDAGGYVSGATVEAAIQELGAMMTAAAAANADGRLPIPLGGGVADGGTWTLAADGSGGIALDRAGAAGVNSYWLDIPVPHRSTASRGITPTGMQVAYQVDSADLDDVRFEVWKVTFNGDGSAPTAAELFGGVDADYPASHDTPAKRGDDTAAPELHEVTITDAGTPTQLTANESLRLRVYVDGDAGGSGSFKALAAVLLFTETGVDVS